MDAVRNFMQMNVTTAVNLSPEGEPDAPIFVWITCKAMSQTIGCDRDAYSRTRARLCLKCASERRRDSAQPAAA